MNKKSVWTKPESRADEIVDYIGNLILEGRWSPGERIDDATISNELGVSRNSVREALTKLTALRALEKRQWSGYFIPTVTWENAKNTLDVRKNLEILAINLFMKNPNEKAIKEIEKSILKSEVSFKNLDLDSFEKFDYEIHEIIQRNCNNPWIPHFMSQIHYSIHMLRHLDKLEDFKQFGEISTQEHWELLGYIKDNNKVEAIKLIHKHFDNHWERLNKVLIKNGHLPK